MAFNPPYYGGQPGVGGPSYVHPPPGGYVPGPMPPPGAYPPGPGCPPPIGPGPNWQMPPPPIENPPVPFAHALAVPAQDGLMVVLTGFIPPTANRFHINMSSGGSLNEDVPAALHFNPRFEGTDQVVRNSFLHGSWGDEERQGHFPFAKGREFEIIVLFTQDCFKVAVNGAHYCDFRYRSRKEDVTHVVVAGDVMIRCLRFQPPAHAPPGPPMNPPPPYMPGPPMAPPYGNPQQPPMAPPVRYDMLVPHEQKIQGGFVEGRKIRISGRPTDKSRFSFNLCYHDSHKKDVAFHFNPRFDERCVVRNTMAGHNWGKEERHQNSMPFKQFTHFDIDIFSQRDKYIVHVNGTPFIEYSHRLRNLTFVKTLYIDGGVELSAVLIQ